MKFPLVPSLPLLLILLGAILLDGCSLGPSVTGSGVLVTKEYAFEGFTAVEISHSFEAEIVQADTFSVSVTADDNLLENLVVTHMGDYLRIGLKDIHSLRNATLQVVITLPRLRGLRLSGASTAQIQDFQLEGLVDFTLSGASELTGGITVDEAAFHLSGASKATLDTQVARVSVSLSGASRITLTGKAGHLGVDGSGASHFARIGLKAATANIQMSGASEATVSVSEEIGQVSLSGASSLVYHGDPKLVDVKTSGASSIKKG